MQEGADCCTPSDSKTVAHTLQYSSNVEKTAHSAHPSKAMLPYMVPSACDHIIQNKGPKTAINTVQYSCRGTCGLKTWLTTKA